MPPTTIAKPAEFARGGLSLTQQALDAQRALLPYALATFAIGLPVFAWAAAHAQNTVWMAASFGAFAIGWAAFYAIVNWLKLPDAADPGQRARAHLLGGVVWAGVVAQMAAFADAAGPAREPLLLMALAAAVVCIFFTAPWLPSLLIVGPAAAAGPLIALFLSPESRDTAQLAWSGFALAMALGLVVNRVLRRQFALAVERETLIAERDETLTRARRLAQSKSDLVATLSHEIRNGLSGVAHVLASAVGQNGRAAPSRQQLAAALDAANGLIEVLNTTLDAETAEAGRLSVAPRPFDAAGMMRELALLNRPAAAAKSLELSVHVEPELEQGTEGAAIADAARVRQILANLLGNALKFTVRGRVEARVELAGPQRLAIEIADTGPGLNPEELTAAFEPFQRVERTSAGTPGAGLGLSLSRELARLMGGDLTARSAPGVGSCFRLEVPFDPSATVTPAAAEPRTPPARRKPDALRILLAEDDALNAAMLRALLEELGHQVVHAQDGGRAVDLARRCEFDLFMIDGRMPKLDGPEAIAQLRALPAGRGDAPIVAVIGGEADEVQACLSAGADAVLRKPVSLAAVARAVADAAAGERAEAARQVA